MITFWYRKRELEISGDGMAFIGGVRSCLVRKLYIVEVNDGSEGF